MYKAYRIMHTDRKRQYTCLRSLCVEIPRSITIGSKKSLLTHLDSHASEVFHTPHECDRREVDWPCEIGGADGISPAVIPGLARRVLFNMAIRKK